MLKILCLLFSTIIVDTNSPQPHDQVFSAALQAAVKTGDTVKITNGTLLLTHSPQELRSGDLKGLTIEGSGDTLVYGVSQNGFDVFQINKSSNLNIRNLKITAKKTGTAGSGVNGISMTNGCSNITIDNVFIYSLPYVMNETWYNGGKGITIQSGSDKQFTISDNIHISRVRISNCPHGLGLDCNPKTGSIRVVSFKESQIDSCLVAFAPSYTESSEDLDLSIYKNTILNCDRFTFNSRANNVAYYENFYKTDKLSGFVDVFKYPCNPVLFLGSNDCQFVNNTLQCKLYCENVFLAGKAPNSCQRLIIARNILNADADTGFSQLKGGITASLFKSNLDFSSDHMYHPDLINNNTVE